MTNQVVSLTFSVFVILSILTGNVYSEGKIAKIEPLPISDFVSNTQTSQHKISIVFFRQPWCRVCPKAFETFEEVFASLKNKNTANGDKLSFFVHEGEEGVEMTRRFRVIQYPTIIAFKKDHMWTYSGDIEQKKIVKWAKSLDSSDSRIPYQTTPSLVMSLLESAMLDYERFFALLFYVMIVVTTVLILVYGLCIADNKVPVKQE